MGAEVATVLREAPADLGLLRLHGQAQFRQLRTQLLAEQMAAHQEMAQLVKASRVDGCPLYLQRHVTRPNKVAADHVLHGNSQAKWHLRWRMSVEGNFQHVTWDEVQPVVSALPLALAQHARQVNRRASELNLIDGLLQGQISRVERFLGMHQSAVGRTES